MDPNKLCSLINSAKSFNELNQRASLVLSNIEVFPTLPQTENPQTNALMSCFTDIQRVSSNAIQFRFLGKEVKLEYEIILQNFHLALFNSYFIVPDVNNYPNKTLVKIDDASIVVTSQIMYQKKYATNPFSDFIHGYIEILYDEIVPNEKI